MKTVILCGGKGIRLREHTESKPKPMVSIGGYPIIWHIMRHYSLFGFNEFILCLGYKSEVIKSWFRDFMWFTSDVTLNTAGDGSVHFHHNQQKPNWTVTLAETGEDSGTAFRLKQIERYLGDDEDFFVTYADGLGDVDVPASLHQHREQSNWVTVTGVHPPARFGELKFADKQRLSGFSEKPDNQLNYINGGYMVCNRKVFSLIPDDPAMMFERGPLEKATQMGKVGAYRHERFWMCMDTYQEFTRLNSLWESGEAPWLVK